MTNVRTIVARILEVLGISLAGSTVTLWYLDATLSPAVPDVHRLSSLAYPALLLVLGLHRIAAPQKDDVSPGIREPSPAWSGAAVVLLTGLAAAYFVARDFDNSTGTMVAIAIAVATLPAAFLLARFGWKYRGQIGEARFRTTGNS